jgi:hypothetical protein
MRERKLLVAASDVGPARYLVELAPLLPFPTLWAGSELTRGIFGAAGLDIVDVWDSNFALLGVATGTQLGPGIDKQAVQRAQAEGVASVTCIEHWSWFRERFLLDGEQTLPDLIVVNDGLALRAAVQAGLPESSIAIGGNPVLERLWRESSTWDSASAGTGSGVVVFISEELESDVLRGRIGAIGYSEFEVARTILECLGPHQRLVIKLHPAEAEGKYAFLGPRVQVDARLTPSDIVGLAEFVVGMGSMLLLELAALGASVISFQPNGVKSFIGDELGATVPVRTPRELHTALSHSQPPRTAFAASFVGSGNRIASLIAEAVLA